MAPAPSLTELIQTVNDRSADQDALTRVATAAEVSGEITSKADLLLGHFVDAARHAGRSWAEIGAALGVTKQGAQQRFVDRDAATPPADEHLLVRYTARARASVARAREEAIEMGHNYVGTEHLLIGVDLTRGESLRLGHNYIGTEHLLLALVAEPDGIGGRVLREHGVDADRARAEVIRALTGYVESNAP